MGDESNSKNPRDDKRQSQESPPKENEDTWPSTRNLVAGPVPLAEKVEESLVLVARLSFIQRRILNLLVDGHGNQTIAEVIGLTTKTVKCGKRDLFAKLGAKTSSDVIRIGIYSQAHIPPDLGRLPD